MTNYAVRQQLDHIDKGSGDSRAQDLLSLWRRSEGRMTDEMIPLFPSLVLMNGHCQPGDSPDLLMCGHDALCLKILGNGWTDSAGSARSFLPPDYRQIVGQAYFEAAQSFHPVFDIIRADMHDTSGRSLSVFYQRLILPVTVPSGARFLLGYSFAAGTMPVVRGVSAGSETRHDHRQETPDYASLLRQADAASQRLRLRTG